MQAVMTTLSHITQSTASLEDILTRATNATTANDRQSLANYLKTSTKDATLASLIQGQGGQDPLALLNPGTNTLAYLYILSARLAQSSGPPVSNAQILAFTSGFDHTQAPLAPERMTMLAKGIQKRAELSKQPCSAVLPLRQILSRYPQDQSLTPIHPIFLTACVMASTPMAAVPLLSTQISSVHVASLPAANAKPTDDPNTLTYLDVLIYHYLGGVLLAMLKKWTMAEEYFEICATAPTQNTNSASAIQVEALKKLVIIQMIAYGKAPPLPKYIPTPLTRVLKSTAYNTLLKSYPTAYNPSDKDVKVFKEDGNIGLVKQALDRSVRWRMRELTNTYVALDLGELCDMVGVGREEGRGILLSMIEDNELNASISLAAGTQTETVTFHSSQRDVPTNAQMRELVVSTQAHAAQLAHLERELEKNKDFLAKAIKTSREEIYPDDHTELFSSRGTGEWADEMNF